MPLLPPLETTVIFTASFLIWRVYVSLMKTSPLDMVRGPQGGTYMAGHMGTMFDVSTGIAFLESMTTRYGGVVKYRGPLNSVYLWVSDPLAMEEILIKATEAFDERQIYTIGTRLMYGPGLLAAVGKQHATQRRLLNPVFSHANIRNLVPLFYDIAHELRAKLTQQIQRRSHDTEIDILDWISRASLEFIGRGGLGYSFGALEGRPNAYRDAAKNLLPTIARMGFLRLLFAKLSTWGPAWLRRRAVELCPLSIVREIQHIVDTMDHTAGMLVEERKKLKAEHTAGGKDILTLMFDAGKDSSSNERLSDEEIRGQVNTLLFAAHETTSGATAQMIEVLAQHPEAQEKLRREIVAATETHPDLDYEQILALPFLDAVCRETLRVYPPVTTIARECFHDAVVPLSTPILSTNGTPLQQITIPKGTTVYLGIRDANRSTSIWGADATEWKPERWMTSTTADNSRLPGVYSSMMTFFGGPRACIGYRMAILEIKLLLVVLLPTLRFRESTLNKVAWRYGATLSPFVTAQEAGGKDRGPELPMQVTLVDDQ